MIPCEECLVYVMCKYRKVINCERLYRWLLKKYRQEIIMDYFPKWIHVSYKPNELIPTCYAFRVSSVGDYHVTEFNKVDGKLVVNEVFSDS